MSDVTTRELSAARLSLADGLAFTPCLRRRAPAYRIRMPDGRTFFEVGRTEATLLSLLDGRTTVAEAVSRLARALGSDALSEREAIAVCQWSLDNGLVRGTDPERTNREAAGPFAMPYGANTNLLGHAKPQAGSIAEPFNPLSLRIPLVRSEAWLDRIAPSLRWVHSAPAALVWMIVVVLGATQLLGEWPRFRASAADLFLPGHWLWTALLWCLLKTIHELSHALACKRYGGSVHEMGLRLILLMPVAYVDVSSSWAFRSRRERMHVAAAGVCADFFIAAVAALAWSATDSSVAQHVLSRIIWLCTLTTVLFNLNPLVRSDGYYLLSDICDVPNLSARSRSAIGRLAARFFLGPRFAGESSNGDSPPLLIAYGLASMAWTLTVTFAILVAAAMWFEGLGLVLAVAGAVMWFGPALVGSVRFVQQRLEYDPATLQRLSLTVAGTAAAIAAFIFLVPLPVGRTAPFVVDFARPAVLRAEGPGFVESVATRDGATVEAGDVLLRLRNADLEFERTDVALQVEAKDALRRSKLNEGDVASAQVAGRDAESLMQRLLELDRQLASLEVRAPIAGRVVARNLAHLEGTWCAVGQELLTIAPDDQRELRAAIAQEDVDRWPLRTKPPASDSEIEPLDRAAAPMSARLPSHGNLTVRLDRLSPRATTDAPHAALVAANGGPLAARATSGAEPDSAKYELVEPRFTATLQIEPSPGRRLAVGETGVIRLGHTGQTLAELLKRTFGW